jgi:hypothetical protein
LEVGLHVGDGHRLEAVLHLEVEQGSAAENEEFYLKCLKVLELFEKNDFSLIFFRNLLFKMLAS